MGQVDTENVPLLTQNAQQEARPKFPLYLFPTFLHPYLELARVEKVRAPDHDTRVSFMLIL